MGTIRDFFVQTKTFVLFLACITIKNRLPVPLPLEPGVKGGGVTSYFPVSAITDRLYARNQFSLIN